jgi:hypothetical protein
VTEIRRLRTTDLALFNRKLADWLVFYNAERPHNSLGQQSPLSFLLQHRPERQRYWTHTIQNNAKIFEEPIVGRIGAESRSIRRRLGATPPMGGLAAANK